MYPHPAPTKVSANAVTTDYIIPDFAKLYPEGSMLNARLAYLLWADATYLADVFEGDDLYRELLPPAALDYVNALPKPAATQWLERFSVGFLRVSDAIERAQVPRPRCTGEEMALHIILEYVSGDVQDVDYLYGEDADLAALPPCPNLGAGLDQVLDWMEDEDILLTFSASPEQLEAEDTLGAMNLAPSKWFLPFKP
jgi:hypothetical protein